MSTPTQKADRSGDFHLGPGERVGIVAGNGLLPIVLARSLVASGHDPVIVMVRGEADEHSALASHEHDFISLEAIAELPSLLKRHGATHAVLAGGIARRPRLLKMKPSMALLRIVPSVVSALARGDDGVLKILVRHLERNGIKVLGAHEIEPDLLASAGAFGRHRPRKADASDLEAAFGGARAIGALDIGQAAVAIGGRVIALEGIEGTDGLLERVVELRRHGRMAGRAGGVLVKCAKPGQELRADLPTIGPATVDRAHAAGLTGIGVEAGRSLVLDFGKVVERADELGMFVVGLTAEIVQVTVIRLAIVAGEESGDLLGADAVRALRQASGSDVELVGIGGRHLRELGLKPLFDAGEIALMGFTAVLGKLPRLIRRIGETARAVADAKPDLLLTIDSPDFSLRVARKVRAMQRSIPIVHYVCPSVWAWRPGRAPAMRPHVDHVLCLLPFEPAELERLGGPPGTFVGHRLTGDPGVLAAARAQARLRSLSTGGQGTLLILPGSRRGEVSGLMEPFRQAASILRTRGNRLRLVLPTVPHVAGLVAEAAAGWDEKPEIVHGEEGKWRAFGEADAALIASGTVSLELALSGVPMVSCYPLDPLAKLARPFITAWSASLPNLIADRVIVPEYYDPYIRPPVLARAIEGLMADGPARQAQKEGFALVRSRMETPRAAGAAAADVLLRMMAK